MWQSGECFSQEVWLRNGWLEPLGLCWISLELNKNEQMCILTLFSVMHILYCVMSREDDSHLWFWVTRRWLPHELRWPCTKDWTSECCTALWILDITLVFLRRVPDVLARTLPSCYVRRIVDFPAYYIAHCWLHSGRSSRHLHGYIVGTCTSTGSLHPRTGVPRQSIVPCDRLTSECFVETTWSHHELIYFTHPH